MNILKKLLKYFLGVVAIIVILLSLNWYYGPGIYLGSEYQLTFGRSDNVYIFKDDEVIVEPTIVDYDTIKNFIVGLRYKVRYLSCKTESFLQVVNEKSFFILNKDNGHVIDLKTRKVFEKKLLELGLLDSLSLDYKKLDIFWEKFSKLYANSDSMSESYLSECKEIPFVGRFEHKKIHKVKER